MQTEHTKVQTEFTTRKPFARQLTLAGGWTATESDKEMEKKIIILGGGDLYRILNPMPDGTCRTIKNQYQKNSIKNFMSTGSWGATAVIRKWKRK